MVSVRADGTSVHRTINGFAAAKVWAHRQVEAHGAHVVVFEHGQCVAFLIPDAVVLQGRRWGRTDEWGGVMGHAAPHLPAEPLFELFDGADDGVIADACGLSRRTIVRWRRQGIPWIQADRICAHLCVHPILLWRDEWNALAGEQAS
jgi:hypothetical protein